MMSVPDVVVLNNLGGGQSVQVDKLPLPGETVKGYQWQYNIDAGKGPNSCIAMARLGVRPAFLGKAGQDAAGDRGESWMKESGVDVSGLLRTTEVSTGQGVRVVEKSGRNLIVCGESSSRALTVDEVCAQLRRFAGARFFVTGFEIREELALAGAKLAHELGMTTLLNFSPIPAKETGPLPFIDYILLNETEGAALMGLADWRDLPPLKIARSIRERFDCGCVLLTLGADGSVGVSAQNSWVVPPVRVHTVDTSGAGDGFLSAFCANLIWGKTPREACHWAGEYAAHTTAAAGTIPSYPLLETYLQTRKATRPPV